MEEWPNSGEGKAEIWGGYPSPPLDALLAGLSEVFSSKCGECLGMGFVLAFDLWRLAFGQIGEGPPVISF